jgi:hypothetical protein
MQASPENLQDMNRVPGRPALAKCRNFEVIAHSAATLAATSNVVFAIVLLTLPSYVRLHRLMIEYGYSDHE